MEIPAKKRKDLYASLEGSKVGKLLIIKRTDLLDQSHSLWLCRCDCGKEVLIRTSLLTSQKRYSCGCSSLDRVKGHTPPNRKNPGESNFLRAARTYKKHAKDADREFSLTLEECFYLFTHNCFYCNSPPSNEVQMPNTNKSFVYSGIDRVDNKLHYVNTNVVSCCFVCNERKRSKNYVEFYSRVRKIYEQVQNLTSISFPLVSLKLEPIIDSIVKRKYLPGVAARNLLITSYKNNARARKLEFKLTKEEAIYLFEANCSYCGDAPSCVVHTTNNNGSYTYNGIDRVDNEKNYTKDNCVPCCKICNTWKSNWTLQQFKEWLFSILNNHNFSADIKKIPDLKGLLVGATWTFPSPTLASL